MAHFVSEPSPPTRVRDGGVHDEASRGQRDPDSSEVEEPARLGRQSESGCPPDRLCIVCHTLSMVYTGHLIMATLETIDFLKKI